MIGRAKMGQQRHHKGREVAHHSGFKPSLEPSLNRLEPQLCHLLAVYWTIDLPMCTLVSSSVKQTMTAPLCRIIVKSDWSPVCV